MHVKAAAKETSSSEEESSSSMEKPVARPAALPAARAAKVVPGDKVQWDFLKSGFLGLSKSWKPIFVKLDEADKTFALYTKQADSVPSLKFYLPKTTAYTFEDKQASPRTIFYSATCLVRSDATLLEW